MHQVNAWQIQHRTFEIAPSSLRESRESVYWLRICLALKLGPVDEMNTLCGEGVQIARILGAIVVNAKRRTQAG